MRWLPMYTSQSNRVARQACFFLALGVAAVYIPLATSYFEIIEQSAWFSILPVITALSYLALAKKYWFKIPFIGVLISTVCFTGAAVLINL
jgi:hypothetical protein